MIKEEVGNLESYELLDSGNGMRLERFGDYILSRPDPAVLWYKTLSEEKWQKADAVFIKEVDEKGQWKIHNKNLPEQWQMSYQIPGTSQSINFIAKLTPFKHTGVFPEQVSNWNFIVEQVRIAIKSGRQPSDIRVLNLFGYTGVASVLASKLGCTVTHVDASKSSIGWAKENMISSGLGDDAIRWILDDCLKFVKRESRRNSKYDVIIMDPPAFGRGAKGEVWKFNENLPEIFEILPSIISESFRFMIVNAYAVSVSSLLLNNLLEDFALNSSIEDYKIEYGELVLTPEKGKKVSTGIFGRIVSSRNT
jgi:23S rRNA (cytosine1962-C5)-methyltransferase